MLAVTGLQIIMSVRTTSGRAAYTVMAASASQGCRHAEHRPARCMLHADGGYDSDNRCREIYAHKLKPDIRQRENPISRGKRHRRRAAKAFDEARYRNSADRWKACSAEWSQAVTDRNAGSARRRTGKDSARLLRSGGT